MRWIYYNPSDGANTHILPTVQVMIRYNGDEREIGDKSKIIELYENGWEDVHYLDESTLDYWQQRCKAAEAVLDSLKGHDYDTDEKAVQYWKELKSQQP